MIIDASAVVAVIWREPGFEDVAVVIQSANGARISALNYLEAAVVIDSLRKPELSKQLDVFLAAANIRIEAVTEAHARLARQAYRKFGKGSGHKARLNMGDCFAYALAKAEDEPLLFKGNDFIHTDIISAL